MLIAMYYMLMVISQASEGAQRLRVEAGPRLHLVRILLALLVSNSFKFFSFLKPLYYIIFISEALNRENSFECIQKSSRLRVNYFLRALINLSPPGMSLVNKLFLDNF